MNRPQSYKKLEQKDMLAIAKLAEQDYSHEEIAIITGFPRRSISHFLQGKGKRVEAFWKEQNPEGKPESHVNFKGSQKALQEPEGLKIVVIPDTQVKPDVPTDHIAASGRYILDHKPDVVVVIGDWWDMPSLNRFGSKLELDGRRVLADIQSGNDAMDLFLSEFNGVDGYSPRLIFTTGNHDPQVRIPRVLEEMPNLEGLLVDNTDEFLIERGFEVYPFLEVVNIEGIRFAHYFQNPHSAKKAPLSGAIDTMLKNAGFSFVQGHTQGLKMGKHYLSDGTRRIGLVAGSFYQHDEAFMGTQGNEHWRGIIQLNEVRDGGADICELSLAYIMNKYGDL